MSNNSIEKELINELSDLLEKNNLTELEWSKGDLKIKVSRNSPSVNLSNIAFEKNDESKKSIGENLSNEKTEVFDNDNSIKSPMVGTAYLAPEPGAKNFISVGDNIKEGQQLLIIEAMKTMNPITATKNGKVKKNLC